jgi:SAM-dependent methyltransferase
MHRILEPEVMDGQEQSDAYAHADFAAPNAAFVERFLTLFPDFCRPERRPPQARAVDLGCGPADILIRLAQAVPRLALVGVDASAAMIEHARLAVAAADLGDRVTLIEAYLPTQLEGPFEAVMSNSLLHHLPDPAVLWDTVSRYGASGAPVLVVDLVRPASVERAQAIVEEYAAGEPEILRHDFFHSLCAAFTLEEVEAQLADAGLGALKVETISDRHLAVWGHLG